MSMEDIESIISNPSKKKITESDGYTGIFYQIVTW